MPELVYEERTQKKEEVRAILLELQQELRSVPKNDVIAVSQVAEKAWVAFVAYVKAASGVSVTNHAGVIAQVHQLIRKDPDLRKVWLYADMMHRFHYAPFADDVHGGMEALFVGIQWVLQQLRRRTKALPD